MKAAIFLTLAVLMLSAVSIEAQWGYPAYHHGRYGPPRFGGGFGSGRFGPRWGQGRGLAFLGSAALLGSGNPLGRAIGGLGLAGLVL